MRARPTSRRTIRDRIRPIRPALIIAVFALFLIVGCSSSGETVPPPGDPSGLTTGSGEQLVGLAPGTITQENYDQAKAAEPFAAQLADLVDQNRLGTNFVWLLMAGFLVMFMQAGFALVTTEQRDRNHHRRHDLGHLRWHGFRLDRLQL